MTAEESSDVGPTSELAHDRSLFAVYSKIGHQDFDFDHGYISPFSFSLRYFLIATKMFNGNATNHLAKHTVD